MYHIDFVKPIPWNIRKTTQQYFEVLDELSPIVHPMLIWVLPMEYFTHPIYGDCWGLFVGAACVQITLAGHRPIENFVETLCHEYSHYEQFRDGKVVKEAGVSVRAKNLVKLVENELLLAV